MIKILAATTSEQKLAYLHEVLSELKLDAEIVSVDVPSSVSEQPITETETKQGSINRARNALKIGPKADFAIGIEVGYHPDSNGEYEIFCCASIVDENGKVWTGESHRVLMPKFHQNLIAAGEYLGHDVVEKFLSDDMDDDLRQVGEDIANRRVFVTAAVREVVGQYLKK